jgi:hypothetical protein
MRYQLNSLVILVSLTGCGPELSKSDLGTVVFEVPKVSGSEEPYKMPANAPPSERDKNPDNAHLP